jgi:diguanylate cyclase (GGDEF)-like protein
MSSQFPFGENVRKLLLQLIGRLVNLRETAPRLRIRQHLKGQRETLDRLLSEGYLVERERDTYVPGLMAFETCGDEFLLSLAKDGTGIVLHTLQSLYGTRDPQTSFTAQEVAEQAKRLFSFVEEEKIQVGLSVLAELNNRELGGWELDKGLVTKVTVREEIIDFTNIEEWWPIAVQSRLALRVQGKQPPREAFSLDPLLQILDRGEFNRDLARFSRAASEDSPTGLVMIDIDGFKQINDTYGHPAGDEVLQKVAAAARSACEGKGFAYRYGGDESAVLLPNFSLGEAGALAERIRSGVCEAKFERYPQQVTVTLGVAIQTDGSASPDVLLEKADANLMLAKKQGKNRVSAGGITL